MLHCANCKAGLSQTPSTARTVTLSTCRTSVLTVMRRSIRSERVQQWTVVTVTQGTKSLYCFNSGYRSGTVNSKSFVGKVLLQIKWKFELTVHFKHGILGKV